MSYSRKLMFLIFSFVIATNSFSFSKEIKKPVTDPKLKKLLTCLTSAGVNRAKIHTRGSGSEYNELNFQWNTMNGYIEPLAYLVATAVSDIQKAVVCCRSSKVRIVPRSGGHSYVKNGFGDSQTLVVDLASMHDISLDEEQMSCEVGPGARNGRISYTLWKQGFVVAQGICPSVGISGLTMGGGYGHFSRILGITSDNLIETEMVDANGKILVANESTNDDLFWALRGGGGGNFGIVTKFKFKLHKAPKSIPYGKYKYRMEDFDQFWSAWQNLTTSTIPNNIFSMLRIEDGSIEMKLFSFNRPDLEVVTVKRIENLVETFSFPATVESSVRLLSHSEFLLTEGQFYSPTLLTDPSQLVNLTRHNNVGWKKVKSFYIDKKLKKNEISKLHELFNYYQQYAAVTVEFFGGVVDKVPRSKTAFVHRGKNLYHFQLRPKNSQTERPNADSETAMKTFYDKCKGIFNHKESYQNYLDEDMPDFLKRYYGENLKKLIQVKRRIDLGNVFHHPQSIPVDFDYIVKESL